MCHSGMLQMCTYPKERAARSSTTIVCKPTIHADTEFLHKPTTIFVLDAQGCDHTTSRLEFVCGHWSKTLYVYLELQTINALGHNQ